MSIIEDGVLQLVIWCRQHGLSETDLDDLVHDAVASEKMPEINETPNASAQESILGSAEAQGATINNQGLEEQIAFLVRCNGLQEAKLRIENLLAG